MNNELKNIVEVDTVNMIFWLTNCPIFPRGRNPYAHVALRINTFWK